MHSQKPPHQLLIEAVALLVIGAVLLGAFLDAVLNALSVPPIVTYAATALSVAGTTAAYIRLRRKPLIWVVGRGQRIQITRLRKRTLLGIAGATLLLWIPRFTGPRSSPHTTADVPAGPLVSTPQDAKQAEPQGLDTARADDAQAVMSLVSFTLNTGESFFELRYDDPWGSQLELPIWSRTKRWFLVDHYLARALGLEEDCSIDCGDPLVEGGDSAFVARITAADSIELGSRLAPVFDLTLMNRGEGAAVLWGFMVHVLQYQDTWGVSTQSREIDPAPIPVLHRYPIRIAEVVEERSVPGREVPDTIHIFPPIEIPARRAARLQVQLIPPKDSEATAFRGRLRLLFNDGASVVTGPFSVLM
ncbi:MAG TPA: hypothetical protein VF006_13095 [Longimicrobium sp.]